MPSRGLPRERLHVRDRQRPTRTSVGRAQQIEVGALDARVAGEDVPALREIPAEARIPRLDQAESVLPVHAPVVRRRRSGREQRVFDVERGLEARDDRLGDGRRRLCAQPAGDVRVRGRVVGDAVPAAHDRAPDGPVGEPDAGTDVVRIRVDQARGELPREWSGAAGLNRHDGCESRRGVEVGEQAARLGVRRHQLVAKAHVERELRALLPVVFDVRVERSASKLCRAPDLQRRLLRNPEQEVSEGRAVAGGVGDRDTARGIQPGEGERAGRVGVEHAGAAVEAIVPADPELVRRVRVQPEVARGDSRVRA